jgi:hypothetical protein
MQESRNYAFDKRNFEFALAWLVLLRHGLESRVTWGEPEKRTVTQWPRINLVIRDTWPNKPVKK